MSNPGAVGGAAAGGGTVGLAIAGFINHYAQVPEMLHSDTGILCVFGFGVVSGIVTAWWTKKVDRNQDGVPDIFGNGPKPNNGER